MKLEFNIGDKVKKHSGDYSVTGTVVAAFHKKSGKPRYVVECDVPEGLLLIFNSSNIKKI